MSGGRTLLKLLAELETSRTAGEIAADRIRFDGTGVIFPHGEALLGLNAEGRPHLVIPLSSDTASSSDRESRGIFLEVLDLYPEGGKQRYLDVWSPLPEYDRLFAIVADEILGSAAASPEAPVGAAREVLDSWRQLLGTDRRRALGVDVLAPLVAELHSLLLLKPSQTEALVEAWQGPRSGRHDIVTDVGDLEVKSTLSPSRWVAKIANLEQLAPFGQLPLYLYFVRLEIHPAGQLTAPGLIDELVARGISRAAIYGELQGIGYQPVDEVAYEKHRFEVVETALYLVDPSFPKLTRMELVDGKLAQGIGSVKYDLDLEAAGVDPYHSPEVVFATLGAAVNGVGAT